MPRLSFLALVAFAGCAAVIRPVRAAATQSVASFQRAVTKTVAYQYLLSLPTGYEAAPDRRWPVILFLHGSGERGTDPWLVAVHGPPKLIRGEIALAGSATAAATAAAAPTESADARAQREHAAAQLKNNFIVVSPQCPVDAWWDDDAVLAL